MSISFRTICVAGVLVASPAYAQSYPINPLDLNSMFIGQSLSQDYEEECDDNCQEADDRQDLSIPTSPDLNAQVRHDFSFTPSETFRAQAVSRFLTGLGGNNPEVIEQVNAQDLFGITQQQITPLGLDVNDLSDAVAFLLIGLWEIGTEQPYDATASVTPEDRETAQAVKRFTEVLLARTNGEIITQPRQLQMASDQVWLLTMALGSQAQSAHSDGSVDLANLTTESRMLGRQILGVDVRDLTLTTDGFAPKNPEAFAAKYGQ